MKNTNFLIVHPKDSSTSFLEGVGKHIPDPYKTTITGGYSTEDIRSLILKNDRLILMGHGTPYGLLSVSQFPGKMGYVIDDTMVDILREKENNILIWCYASSFADLNGLKGFFTGMFISEVSEALIYNMHASQKTIDESNECFVNVISKLITSDAKEIYESIMVSEYQYISQSNPIAKYNIDRLKYIN